MRAASILAHVVGALFTMFAYVVGCFGALLVLATVAAWCGGCAMARPSVRWQPCMVVETEVSASVCDPEPASPPRVNSFIAAVETPEACQATAVVWRARLNCNGKVAFVVSTSEPPAELQTRVCVGGPDGATMAEGCEP